MTGVWAIASREVGSLLRLPVGWIVIALFTFLSAVIFVTGTLIPGQPATMRYFFASASWMLIPVAPAISMRLVSEELRSGTIEPLRTAPVSDSAVVWGKYLGSVAFLGLMLAPTLALVAVLVVVGEPKPDPGPILAGYLALILTGMLYLAVGLLASVLTASQTLAFLGTLMFLILMMVLSSIVATSGSLPEGLSRGLVALGVQGRVRDMAKGVVDTGGVVFFLAASAWFVLLACAALSSRRWR
ncbi:MAG: ABC transporter permease subunit [Phycisphaerales bacterium JB059]